jgi:hypothetical protein
MLAAPSPSVHAALEAVRAYTEQMLAAALLETVRPLGRLPGSSLRADGCGHRARPFSLEITGIFHAERASKTGAARHAAYDLFVERAYSHRPRAASPSQRMHE